MNRINVTKAYMPPIDKYRAYLDKIWANGQMTNQGPLLTEFEKRVKQYLGVENFHFVANGTLALQLALRALDITDGEVITTPFSYVATASSILWERCKPVFVDIDPDTLCIDHQKIEKVITNKTKAIMPVHVFGYPCDVEEIQKISLKHGLKVIYDGAHAFGVKYKTKSLLDAGDISTCSFHATKLFHTIEGGAVVLKDKKVSDKVELIKRFGHEGDEHHMLGINAKTTEFQAAMGLCNLEDIDKIIETRRSLSEIYNSLLHDRFQRPVMSDNLDYNYGYYPVILSSESKLKKVLDQLSVKNIFPRRYFYPSLNTLPYLVDYMKCPVSEDIASRILCLPLYADLDRAIVKKIAQVVVES